MERKTSRTSESQNDTLETVHRGVINNEGRCNGSFSLIVHKTAALSNKEQISLCVQYIVTDFAPVVFLGFIETVSATEEELYKKTRDAPFALKLDLNTYRG